MHDLMLKARVLEERLIRMQKQGDGYFWIGGPGEEAFNTALGLLVQKGEGLDFDYTHLHYRSSATLLAMGADPVDALRQMRMLATDPHSGGRNFVGHYSVREWNVCPITSPIEVQYSMAIGTARAQRRPACKGITIVQGGDAGTAEGDFATCLVWSSRPGNELPILIIVTNNRWGISTHASTQHGEAQVADRGKPFGIRTMTIDGNDATTAYRALEEAMEYVRTERKPLLLEAMVSRLYGHSSSSGSNYTDTEPDCLKLVGAELEARNLRSSEEAEAIRERHFVDLQEASRRIKSEPKPQPNDIWKHVFAEKGTNGDA
jgi:2-oxoisovalerate dehydrogenase E1 component alpha subunit